VQVRFATLSSLAHPPCAQDLGTPEGVQAILLQLMASSEQLVAAQQSARQAGDAREVEYLQRKELLLIKQQEILLQRLDKLERPAA
jgi:hypothetical protein